jgi:hypothetical protein
LREAYYLSGSVAKTQSPPRDAVAARSLAAPRNGAKKSQQTGTASGSNTMRDASF